MLKGERWRGNSAVSPDTFGKSPRETFHPEIQKGPVNFKFGVLYAKGGQLTDGEMFGDVGVPTMKWCGAEGDRDVMVVEPFGPSLEDLFSFCSRKFSPETVLLLADQTTCAVCKPSVALLEDKRNSPEKVFGNKCKIDTGKELERFMCCLWNYVLLNAPDILHSKLTQRLWVHPRAPFHGRYREAGKRRAGDEERDNGGCGGGGDQRS
ncbi:uncharacterized protein LOC106113025 isoform X2 [Falco peregrinus]|uniref:uncharacterized protein LOC106113025 isoform X2 n=1 Tax=Falco peregrinus TaxID=8954 RepID=UPI00247944D7|nr:uncharacterized protein LOC106113025 isoform X2 [Falco peregrinus]